MENLGLFTIEKRVQPALPESYIITVKFSEEPKGFYTRIHSIYQNEYLYLTKEVKKRLFKDDLVRWRASFEPSRKQKKIEDCKKHAFRRIMDFKFKTEIDMIDASYTLERFLDEIISREFINFQMAVNSGHWNEKM